MIIASRPILFRLVTPAWGGKCADAQAPPKKGEGEA